MKIKDELHKELNRAYDAVMKKHDVRREYVQAEWLALELVDWVANLIDEAKAEAVKELTPQPETPQPDTPQPDGGTN